MLKTILFKYFYDERREQGHLPVTNHVNLNSSKEILRTWVIEVKSSEEIRGSVVLMTHIWVKCVFCM